jgi:putative oxidoreductase
MLYYGPLVARIFLGLVFILAGFTKMTGFAGTVGYFESLGLPLGSILVILVIITEIVGGLMLVIGWKPRIAAWWLAAFTLITIVVAHRDLADQMQMTQALKNLAIIGGLLMVAMYGAGPLSLDGRASRFVESESSGGTEGSPQGM